MKFEIIKTRGRWGEYNYDLQTESFRRRIYKPESSAPYILLDGDRINLPPEMRKRLTTMKDCATDVIEARQGEWISTAECQPEKSGLYLTYHAKRGSMTMHYSANNEAWNAFDHEMQPKYALEVTHWMHLPEPPKER